jgi:hypothetical protein
MNIELAKLRWHQQKAQAKNRLDKNGDKILWKLSFDDWFKIWQDSGYWEQRGVGSGKYCMSRLNDIGNYEVGNVEIKLQSQNVIEGQLGRKFPQKGRPGKIVIHSEETKQKMSVGRLAYLERLKDKENVL